MIKRRKYQGPSVSVEVKERSNSRGSSSTCMYQNWDVPSKLDFCQMLKDKVNSLNPDPKPNVNYHVNVSFKLVDMDNEMEMDDSGTIGLNLVKIHKYETSWLSGGMNLKHRNGTLIHDVCSDLGFDYYVKAVQALKDLDQDECMAAAV